VTALRTRTAVSSEAGSMPMSSHMRR
jgi:hypothetical protein